MSEQTIEKVSGSGDVVNSTSRAIDGPPAAHITTNRLWHTQIRWSADPRPATEEDTPRSLSPYWEITEYTDEEINAIREADQLDPDLAEYYKDLLED